MSEGDDQPGGAFGPSSRTPVGAPAASSPPDPPGHDDLFAGRPPAPGWTPGPDQLPPGPAPKPSAAGWPPPGAAANPTSPAVPSTPAIPSTPAAPATSPGEIDLETWLKLSDEADGGAPPRPTWTLSTGQFPVVTTGQFPIVPERAGRTVPSGLDSVTGPNHRWRTVLALTMAILLTAAVVIAYKGGRHSSSIDGGVGPGNRQSGATQPAAAGTSRQPVPATGPPPVNAYSGQPAGPVLGTTPAGAAAPGADPTAVAPDAGTTPTSAVADPADSTGAVASNPPPADPASPVPAVPASASAGATPTSLETVRQPGPSAQLAPPPAGELGTRPGIPQSVQARPPKPGTRLEAETLQRLGNATMRSDHAGYSGNGFVTDILAPGSGISWTLDNPGPAGPLTLRVRYSAGNGGSSADRTLTALIDGTVGPSLTMPRTPAWNVWHEASVVVNLPAGISTLSLVVGDGDNGFVAIDYLTVG